jgi:hypothetical protein
MKNHFHTPIKEKQISGLAIHLQKRPITGQYRRDNAQKKPKTHQSCTRPPQKDA